MINKVAYRNAKKSINDYFIYLITMIIISALMFAFNSMIFSKDIIKLCSMAGIMAAMIGVASVFIMFVVSWLINYMVQFMMKKKSREFGVYLLIGMKKKEVSSLFIKENALVGVLAFFLGIIPGVFLQQVFTNIFYSIYRKAYSLKIQFSIWSFLLSLVLFLGIYFLALRKNKKKLKKMTIRDMMDFHKENEKYTKKNEKLKGVLFFISIAYFILFDILLLNNKYTIKTVWIFIGLLVVAIYLFYLGISSFVVSYIRNKSKGIYKKERLFLLRQFSAKLRTMQFTMSTLTILFVFAILGCTIAMMFNGFLDKRLDYQLPFDIIVFSDKADDSFTDCLTVINKETKIKEQLIYNVYENGSDDINEYMLKRSKYYANIDEGSDDAYYFDYDTFMKISDYNKLRKMIGYNEVELSDKGFIVHAKNNLMSYLKKYFKKDKLAVAGTDLVCEGEYEEAFAQSGQNGADYIIVVPDSVAESMNPLYSLLAVDIEGDSPEGLQKKLDDIRQFYDEDGNFHSMITWGFGTDTIISCTGTTLVQTNLMDEMKFVIIAVAFPFIYISLIFVCVALTVLSVQQISDSAEYKYRYSVLSNLGLKEREIDWIIFKQLLIYYAAPFIISIAISSVLAVYIGGKFNYFTGINSSQYTYFGISTVILSIIYIIYFIATFVEFKRNVHKQ